MKSKADAFLGTVKCRAGFLGAAVFWAVLLQLLHAGDPQESDTNSQPQTIAHRGASHERPECTIASLKRAIELKTDAVEIDVRTSKDGVLFLLHDATLDRTTNGTGPANQFTMGALKKLDAGSWFNVAYRTETIPTLAEALVLCRGKIGVLLDLKEQGESFAKTVAGDVLKYGDESQITLGVRSVPQAQLFRRLLPRCKQLGFIAAPDDIEDFAKAGVETIRLWPDWFSQSGGRTLIDRVRTSGAKLHLNGATGTPQEILPLLRFVPDSLLVDDPAALIETLIQWRRFQTQHGDLMQQVEFGTDTPIVPWLSGRGMPTFLNRKYTMLQLPTDLQGQGRVLFAGGEGHKVVLSFRQDKVVFAALEYNQTGAWSFPEGFAPADFGWTLVPENRYRGTSNATINGKPNDTGVYFRKYAAGESLRDMPPWWICLGIVDPNAAAQIVRLSLAATDQPNHDGPFMYGRWATAPGKLQAPEFKDQAQWLAWQMAIRRGFRRRLIFKYENPISVAQVGEPVQQSGFQQQEFHTLSAGKRLFRFFRLMPAGNRPADTKLPTIVCFMGHGKVSQILKDTDSYQHACAAHFAEAGYLVYAMENVGMEPGRDRHHDLDRILRLNGHGWYSLLFAHQQILLDQVFADPQADVDKVGVTGVSTGGLLALSAIGMDSRVAAASVQGIFGSMRVSFIRDRDRHCGCGAIPGLLPQFDLPELALLASPRPLHISNATEDGFGPAEAQRQIERISPRYHQSGGEIRFTSPPGRHEFSIEQASRFFADTIGEPR